MISDSFIIIRDFIADELGEDPKSLLGDQYWKILVEVNEVHEKEKLECNASLQQLNYFNPEILNALQAYRCVDCGSVLIESTSKFDEANEAIFKCRTCEKESDYDDIINQAITDYFVHDVYISYNEGGDTPVIDCPFCHDGSYLVFEGICASCGDSATHECSRCGCSIPTEEISDDDVCGYCAYMWQKVMAE